MGGYRIVDEDGTTWAADTEVDARFYSDYLRRNRPGGTFTIQREAKAWVDVPEPKPLPDLPAEVFFVLGEDGRFVLWMHNDRPADSAEHTHGRRTFRGTVTHWEEVQ